MDKLIHYLSTWGYDEAQTIETGIDLGDFWEPKEGTAKFYLYSYGNYLVKHKYIDEPLGDFNPPTSAFLLKTYKEILDKEKKRAQPNPKKDYYRLYASVYFFDILIYSLPSCSIKLTFKMDACLFRLTANCADSLGYYQGATGQKKSFQKKILDSRLKKYNTFERRAAVLKAAKNTPRPPVSFNHLRDMVIEQMTKLHDVGKGPKPYAKTQTRKILLEKYSSLIGSEY